VVAYANSLDTVGFMSRDVKTIRAMFGKNVCVITAHHQLTSSNRRVQQA